jgi:hypothetical protein
MRFTLYLTAAALAMGQPAGDGVPLLRQVAEAAATAKGWRVEGTMEGWVAIANSEPQQRFTLSRRSPLELRHVLGELEGEYLNFTMIVCDGSSVLNRRALTGVSAYRDDTVYGATAHACQPPIVRWEDLLDSLKAATMTGEDAALGCTEVRAEYSSGNSSFYFLGAAVPFARTVCVDLTTNLVRWEQLEVGRESALVKFIYTKVERDPDFAADEFAIPPAAFPWRRQDLRPKLYPECADCLK